MNESGAAMAALIESWWERRIVSTPSINDPLFLKEQFAFFVAVAVAAAVYLLAMNLLNGRPRRREPWGEMFIIPHILFRLYLVLMSLLIGVLVYNGMSSTQPPGFARFRPHPPSTTVPSSTTVTFALTTSTASGPQFTVPPSADRGANLIPNVKDPDAADPQMLCPGYRASNVRTSPHGLTADLDLAGDACDVYGNDVPALSLVVEYQAKDRLHVEILPRHLGPENYTWFVLPEELVPKPSRLPGVNEEWSDLVFEWDNSPTFSFTVTRRSTGHVLFSTAGSKLVYEDQFFELVVPLPENYNLYGLGEVVHGFRLGTDLTRTLYAADESDPIDRNIYGTHPVYLETRYFADNGEYVVEATDQTAEYTSFTHGVFLRNAHGQEVLLRPSGITWRALGGTIDLYFYSGPTATAVMQAYQESAVGFPAMQQYWTFGYHQCRWGYQGWDGLQEVIDDFARFELPLETIWADIDYMNQFRDFSANSNGWSYEQAGEFFARLRKNGQHFVPVVDSAIYVPNPENASDAYPTYQRGLHADAYMLNPDGSLYIGCVWPGYTVFPDWVGAVLAKSKTFEWWANELAIWHEKIDFSGIWIDMSEVSSFCVGSCGTGNITLNPVHPPFTFPGDRGNEIIDYPEGFELTNASEAGHASLLAVSREAARASTSATSPTSTDTTSYLRTRPTPGMRNVNHPPYVLDHVKGDLTVHAVSPNATHHGGTAEYDFHNLWGHQALNATYHALLLRVLPGRRPFVIGRSTFAGSGRWAGHWGGDNQSRWRMMALSIPHALGFSLFGVPMFGVDVCGFEGNTDLELCARWIQLGAFLPFFRNHNMLGSVAQEPYRWAAVADAARSATNIRYALLPYLYTAFWRAHARGDPVVRALAWEFPREPWLAAADRQFLLGHALLVTPVLTQGATTVDGVFPGGGGTVWYDWHTRGAVPAAARGGENVTLAAPLGHINLHVRGGAVLPMQKPAMTTKLCRESPWDLLAALDAQGRAAGELYVDDGESIAPEDTLVVEFTAAHSALTARPKGEYRDTNPLADITVMGIQGKVTEVKFNGEALDEGSWNLDGLTRALVVSGLQSFTESGAWVSEWTLAWG